MRKTFIVIAAAALLFGLAPQAGASGWGLGGFVGSSIPIAQEDAEKGIVFGAHVRLSVGGMLGIEPNITMFRNGDWDLEDDGLGELFEGSDIFAVGVNAILGGSGPVTGFRPFFFAGVKFYNEKNDFRDFSEGSVGWNAGLGFEIGGGPIGLEVRASGEVLPLDRGGSRKWVHVRGGINYYFGAL